MLRRGIRLKHHMSASSSPATTAGSSSLGMSRYYPADHSVMLFAHFLDQYCLRYLGDQCKEFCELVFGGAEVVPYRDEIRLVSYLTYYVSCLLALQSTLGQQFCGLSLYQVLPVSTKFDTSNRSSVFQERITKPADKSGLLKTYLTTSLLYAVLPYLYSKRSVIWSNIYEFWEIITSSEAHVHIPNNLQSTSHQEGLQEQDGAPKGRSFFSLIVTALHRSVMSISNEVDVKLERVISFLSEIHLLIFLINSK